MNQLVNYWRKNYLLSLQEFREAKMRGQEPCVKTENVVILKDKGVKRMFAK